jgi:DNA-directed RNA polymerase sigma subunit (sigma70/sigma32)
MQQMIQGVNLMPHHISSDSQKIAQELLKKTSAKQLQKELTPNTRKVMEKRTWIPGGTYDTDPTGRAIEIAEDT